MLTCVCGLGWGDEGKGKIVDFLARDYDTVVRYNGGANAGHTVVVDGEIFKLNNLPCGVLQDKECILAAGMVLNPLSLVSEIERLMKHGINPRIKIDPKIHCVMPWHIEEDAVTGKTVGTTCRGIGPCYAEKMHRRNAIRFGDLAAKLSDTLRYVLSKDVFEEYNLAVSKLYKYIEDTGIGLRHKVSVGTNILFESANGIHLDIDHGTFPFVTSSAVGPAAIPQSCGLPNVHLNRIIGVTKCYATRVGEGPFPSEITGTTADTIRAIGKEFGTTTGRPRRIGWLDMDKLTEGISLTGATEIALTHSDTLSSLFSEIKVKAGDKYLGLSGWDNQTEQQFEDFINTIESFARIPVTMIGYGPERHQIKRR